MSLTVNDIIAMFQTRGRGDPPSALADIFVNPLARTLGFLDSKLNLANAEQTVDNIVALLENPDAISAYSVALNETTDAITLHLQQALDAIASNFGIVRRAPAGSTGLVSYYRNSSPASYLPITIGAGRRVFCPTANQEYKVTSTISFNTVPNIDSQTSRYYFTVPVSSQNTGLKTVIGTGLITVMKDSIPGLDGVVNPSSIVGGRDKETDRELAARIKSSLASNNIGTKSGYEKEVLNIAGVKGVSVVGAGDLLMQRGDVGSVDIYVTDPKPILISGEQYSSDRLREDGVYYYARPKKQPIINDTTTVNPTPHHIVKDISPGNGGSVRAYDELAYETPRTLGEGYSFQANALIGIVQEHLDDPSKKMLGADVLVREAYIVEVDVVGQIVVLSGFVASDVVDNVSAAVSSYIAALNIGQNLEQSDIIRIATSVSGVDRLNIPMTKFNRTDGTESSVNTVEAQANEVLRANLVQIST